MSIFIVFNLLRSRPSPATAAEHQHSPLQTKTLSTANLKCHTLLPLESCLTAPQIKSRSSQLVICSASAPTKPSVSERMCRQMTRKQEIAQGKHLALPTTRHAPVLSSLPTTSPAQHTISTHFITPHFPFLLSFSLTHTEPAMGEVQEEMEDASRFPTGSRRSCPPTTTLLTQE